MNRRRVLATTALTTLTAFGTGCLRSGSRVDRTPRSWRQFGRDATHTAAVTGRRVPRSVETGDRHSLDGDAATSPVTGTTDAFAADERGLFVAPFDTDRTPGYVPLPGATPRVPAVDADGRVLVTRETDAGPRVAAVLPSDRQIAWERRLDGTVVTAPAVADGVVYVATDAGAVALDTATGDDRWRVDATVSPDEWERLTTMNLAPAVADDVVVFPTGDGVVTVSRGGVERWRVDCRRVRAAPAVRDGVVYVPDLGVGLRAIDLDAGRELWRHAAEQTWATPAVGERRVFAGTTAGLAILDRETGTLRRVLDQRIGLIPSAVAVVGDVVVTATREASVLAVTLAGDRIAPLQVRGEGGFAAPAVADGRYVFTEYTTDGFQLSVTR